MQYWSKITFKYANKIGGEAIWFVLINKLDEKSKNTDYIKDWI